MADRDGLADRGELPRHRAAAGEARFADEAGAGLRRAGAARERGGRRADETGAIAIRLPLPPGALPTLWNDDERFVSSYLEQFPGHYVTGDGGHLDEDGYLFVMGRIDDVINVAGHRLSTGSMEEVLATHADVAECAVIGVPDELRGEVPFGFVVLKAGVDRDARRDRRASSSSWCATRSARSRCSATRASSPGCRRPARARSCAARCARSRRAREYRVPSTIDDPAILEEIAQALA